MASNEPLARLESDPEYFTELTAGAEANNLLTYNAVIISTKLDIPALKAHLVENGCITWNELDLFKDGTRDENNMKFAKHISHRGAHAVNGFMRALQQSTVDGEGQITHRELFNELRKGVPASRRESRVPLSTQTSTASVTTSLTLPLPLPLPLPPTVQEEQRTAERSNPVGQETSECRPSETSKQKSPAKQPTAKRPEVPEFKYFLWSVSVVTCICSPVFFFGGATLLVLSILGFANTLECDGVGAPHSLTSFNFFYGLLCLSIPGLLVMLTFYFCCEEHNSKWEMKFHALSTKCLVVWMTIGFFLALFIFTVLELLYSITYIIPEVYTNYSEWNETLCNKEIYLTSFVVITFSEVIVFIFLAVLGVFLAILFFKWVIDPDHPGTLRGLIGACYPQKTKTESTESSIV